MKNKRDVLIYNFIKTTPPILKRAIKATVIHVRRITASYRLIKRSMQHRQHTSCRPMKLQTAVTLGNHFFPRPAVGRWSWPSDMGDTVGPP